MAPPLEVLTKRRTPCSRAASRRLTVPSTFVRASKAGSATDLRTSICAARWKTTSGRSLANSSPTTDASRMSTTCRRAPLVSASPRLDSRPVERLSRTATSSPRSSRASTRLDPMKPAPPVTRARMERATLASAVLAVLLDPAVLLLVRRLLRAPDGLLLAGLLLDRGLLRRRAHRRRAGLRRRGRSGRGLELVRRLRDAGLQRDRVVRRHHVAGVLGVGLAGEMAVLVDHHRAELGPVVVGARVEGHRAAAVELRVVVGRLRVAPARLRVDVGVQRPPLDRDLAAARIGVPRRLGDLDGELLGGRADGEDGLGMRHGGDLDGLDREL